MEGRIEGDEVSYQMPGLIATSAAAAIAAGATDPFVKYLDIRYNYPRSNLPPNVVSQAYHEVAEGMKNSQYPPFRRMGPLLRVEELKMSRVLTQPTASSGPSADLVDCLKQALADQTTPDEEIYELGHEYVNVALRTMRNSDQSFQDFLKLMRMNWSQTPVPDLLEGEYYAQNANPSLTLNNLGQIVNFAMLSFQQQRPDGEEQRKKLWKQAERAYLRAIDKDPANKRAYVGLIELASGQPKDTPRMEKWFQKSMELDPNNYAAVQAKMHYLEPGKNGSEQELLDFCRECAQSKVWGGRVLLSLPEARISLSRKHLNPRAIWSDMSAWQDVKLAYDAFLGRYPDDVMQRHWFITYAVQFKQYAEIQKQLTLLGDKVEPNFFGGVSEFEKFKERINQQVSQGAR